jgi:hypothetical protein
VIVNTRILCSTLAALLFSAGAEAAVTITAGIHTYSSGSYAVGYIPGFIGSGDGATTFYELRGAGGSPCDVSFSVTGLPFDVGKSFFTVLTTSIHYLPSAQADYLYYMGTANWSWSNVATCGMTAGQSYTISAS